MFDKPDVRTIHEILKDVEEQLKDLTENIELLPDQSDMLELIRRELDSLEERLVRRILRGS